MSTTPFIIGMRDAFFDELYKRFAADRNAVFISADNGAPTLDKFSSDLPGQFFTVGIAEQQLIGMACGMACEGRKVYTYAIAPFVTLRCIEQVKLDVCAMNLPIVNVGIGAGYAYDIMGPSHHTVEDISMMRALPNLVIYSPCDSISAAALASITFDDPRPQYVRFDRSGIPDMYTGRKENFADGLVLVQPGKDIALVATGVMVHQAMRVASVLATKGLKARVIDLIRLKPINRQLLLKHLCGVSCVVTMEEHLLAGGMGSAVAELLMDEGLSKRLLRIGQDDRFTFDYGGRDVIWEKYGMDVRGVTRRILKWLDKAK
ncbi:MAG: 1-deoxy-D-xylulose-5-phosphate synthase [Verrucomicrobia bacterium]|nr:1-deoxy-D-xylulose-5-phosphate synthase [Verrucomicrobiota bacterium]